eukprot:7469581-Prorocentrum_lima.AAC.1
MTSSLVGSEMCIRDSVRSGQVHGRGGAPARAQPYTNTHTPHDHGACLLYTSDAADDCSV